MEIPDALHSFGFLGKASGDVGINFKGAMTATSDKELVLLLSEAQKGMSHWLGRFRLYQNINNELEYAEVTDLKFKTVGVGLQMDDIIMRFGFTGCRRVFCA